MQDALTVQTLKLEREEGRESSADRAHFALCPENLITDQKDSPTFSLPATHTVPAAFECLPFPFWRRVRD